MVTRIGGLASGMDIDSIVEKLMNAERAPLNKLNQQKTTYEWQRDAYRGVNTKLKALDTYVADNLVLKTLNSKTASSSNSSLVTATATGKATGSLSIEGVSQLATSTKAVGSQQPITNSMSLRDVLGGSMPSEIKLGSINAQGSLSEQTTIKLDADMTVDQFVSKVNSSNAGISAVFENGQFSITTKNTGRLSTGGSAISMDNDAKTVFAKFGITEDKIEQGQNTRFIVNGIATERSSNSFSINGYNVTLNATFNEKDTYKAFAGNAIGTMDTAQTQLDQSITNLASKPEYFVDLSSVTATADQSVEDIKYKLLSKKISDVIDAKIGVLQDKNDELNDAKSLSLGTQNARDFLTSLTDEQKAKFQSKVLTTAEIDELNLSETQKAQYANLSEQDKESFTKTAGSVYSSLGLSKEAMDLLATMNHGDDLSTVGFSEDQKKILEGLTSAELDAIKTVNTKQKAVTAVSTDIENSTKDLQNLNSKYREYETAAATILTAGSAPTQNNAAASVTLSSTTNVDEMMTKIKEFVTTYNGFVKDLSDQLKESKYRDYSPLTAEQKEEMSENEIKLWDEKAKSGLLRNDSLIRNALSNMRTLVYQSNPGLEDSKYNTLFNIGITTSSNYNDGGTLEINESKLRAALEEDPDAVEALFKNVEGKKDDTVQVKDGKGNLVTQPADTRGYLDKLRDSLKAFEVNIEKKAGRSTMTDAQYAIGKSLMNTETRIKTWQDKLENIESRYWKQFTAMETAINKANQQSSIFSQG